jgi:hypothetical protein
MSSPVMTPPAEPPAATPPFSSADLHKPAQTVATPPPPGITMAQLKQEIAAATQPLVEKNSSLAQQNQQLQEELNRVKQGITSAINPNPVPEAVNPEQLQRDMLLDPVGTVQKLVQQQMQPLVQTYFTDKGTSMEEQYRNRYPKIFEKYGSELEAMKKNTHPAHLASAQTWDLMLDLIKGRHLDDFTKDPLLTSAATQGTSFIGAPPTTPKDPVAQLSEKELKTARLLGVTPEKYAAQKTRIGGLNG